MLSFTQPQHLRSQQQSGGQIKWRSSLLACRLVDQAFLGYRSYSAEVAEAGNKRLGRKNNLQRPAVHRRKSSAQDFMPANDFGQTIVQSFQIQKTLEPIDDESIVGGQTRIQLLQKPDSLLRRRERGALAVCCRGNGCFPLRRCA